MDSHMQKGEVGPYLTSHAKMNSSRMYKITVRAKTIKLLEENIDIYLHNFTFGNEDSEDKK
jgi:uncharacterized Fe-S radical SAM superfamily protein PflX